MASAWPTAMVSGESQLRWLLPGVQDAFAKTRADAAREGIILRVRPFGGARTSAIVAQLLAWRDEAMKAGEPYYRVSPFATTKHRYGGALDFEVVQKPAGMTTAQAYARVGELARPHGLLWGGNFSAPADIYHLESQQSLDQLAPRWAAWQNDPSFPRLGAAELSVVVVLALLLILAVAYFFVRGR